VSAAQSHFRTSTPSGGIWHSLNRLLVALIALTVVALVAFRFTPEISKRRVQQAILEGLKAEVEKEQQLLARLTREEELLKHDPEYAGLIARDRLDLMKEGETIYRLDPPRGQKANMRMNR
jgi:cell division protein FtsB